ncbi:MAG TPA: hypothetical protein VIU63_00645 [Nitrospira sp.]
MPRLVAVWRKDEIHVQARQYVRSYILLPSGMLGLVCMLGGVGGLGYQLIGSSSYTWSTFPASTALLLMGGFLGAVQTRYHRYLLDTVPEIFAARLRAAVGKPGKKSKVDRQPTNIDHPGRVFVPWGYVVGSLLLLLGSALAIREGFVDPVPAVLMPWAGFYWGKLFMWRGIVQ